MGDFAYLDIVILAAIAIFIAYRLWSVLGQRTGTERPPSSAIKGPNGGADEASGRGQVIPLPQRGAVDGAVDSGQVGSGQVDSGQPAELPGLLDLKLADRSFDADEFLKGGRWAYELILQAFAKGDEATLRPLLSDEIFEKFAGVIAERRQKGWTVETTLVATKGATIEAIDLQGRMARVTVRFVSDLITVTRDRTGQTVDSHPAAVREVIDLWTFTRDVRHSDPNWTLVETSAGV